MSLESFCDLAHNDFYQKLECEQSRLSFQRASSVLEALAGLLFSTQALYYIAGLNQELFIAWGQNSP